MSKKIGIIGAMKIEIDALAEMLGNRHDSMCSGITFHEGVLNGADVVLAVCGVGKVFAAICAQTMILKYGVDAIVNSGVAGGLSDKLKICSAVIADKVVQHDMDTSPLGDPVGLISGINKVYIDCDRDIINALEKSMEGRDNGYLVGTVASGDTFINDNNKKEYLRSQFGAVACEMEGAAVGHVCYVNDIPFCVFRTISDGGDDSSDIDFPTFAALAAKSAQETILEFLKIYR